MSERQRVQLARLCSRALITLFNAQACHFGPNVRPRRDVVMDESHREPILRAVLIVVKELLGRVGSPQALKIHGQEGHISADIDVAQLV